MHRGPQTPLRSRARRRRTMPPHANSDGSRAACHPASGLQGLRRPGNRDRAAPAAGRKATGTTATPLPAPQSARYSKPRLFPALVEICEFVYMYHMVGKRLQKTLLLTLAVLAAALVRPTHMQASELLMFE